MGDEIAPSFRKLGLSKNHNFRAVELCLDTNDRKFYLFCWDRFVRVASVYALYDS